MKKETIIEKIDKNIRAFGYFNDKFIVYCLDFMRNTVPDDIRHWYFEVKKDRIRIAILCNNGILYDLNNSKQKTILETLQVKQSNVELHTFLRNEQEEINDDRDIKIYRAELRIYQSEYQMRFSGEGSDQFVRTIIEFAQACFDMLNEG